VGEPARRGGQLARDAGEGLAQLAQLGVGRLRAAPEEPVFDEMLELPLVEVEVERPAEREAGRVLVALLRDSYVELDRPLIDAMLARYLKGFAKEGGPKLDADEFVAFFDLLTVQRKLKDAGRFVFIDRVKKNPSFLLHIPSSLHYVRDALKRRPELREVQEILVKHIPELRD